MVDFNILGMLWAWGSRHSTFSNTELLLWSLSPHLQPEKSAFAFSEVSFS